MNQLKSSGTIAYYELIQFGYPIKIKIADLYAKLEPILKPHHLKLGQNKCCQILLLEYGFELRDFKFGKIDIHIRAGKSHRLDHLQQKMEQFKEEVATQFRSGFIAYMRRIHIICLQFIGAREYKFAK